MNFLSSVEIGDHDNGILIILPPSKNEFELDWNDNEEIMHLKNDSPSILKITEKNDERYFNSNNENTDITPSGKLKNI